ncbi:hypothetical protein ABIE67_007453 [Streptomyces sp. V4I8]
MAAVHGEPAGGGVEADVEVLAVVRGGDQAQAAGAGGVRGQDGSEVEGAADLAEFGRPGLCDVSGAVQYAFATQCEQFASGALGDPLETWVPKLWMNVQTSLYTG